MIDRLVAYPPDTRRLVVALSGGRDSIALLHALKAADLDRPVVAVHVCHHLDVEAERWAEFCAAQAAQWDIAWQRLDVRVDIAHGGLEAAARSARYQAFIAMLEPGDVLVTAHHARDQAETVLSQALRGSGMRGLAAMPDLAPLGQGRIWRPWLTVPVDRIAAYVDDHALDFVDDPSNRDPTRERAWLATAVWPALIERRPGVDQALARIATRAAEATEAITALAAIDTAHVRDIDDTLSVARLTALSPARAGEVIRHWLAAQSADRPDHRHIAEIRRLMTARAHHGPRVVWAGTEVRCFDGRLFVMSALAPPPAPDTRIDWPAPEPLELPGAAGRLSLAPDSPRPARWPAGLAVSFRQGGERLSCADDHDVSLKRFLQARRVPPWVRERMPLLYADSRLIAVADRWRSPDWQAVFGRPGPRLIWSHGLAGDPACVVASRALG